ncbi:uncharacterized protein LOC127789034 isoform X2 [Diospyros lotus]|uniref:uncharacterized protein LOC127789034 isoform X2 n=1 Tax=Diospyros lotus TaxID=55363 RepID=UPI00224E14CD|nr:uncharacterized protein LOC127789034 isoform X2 [Diospyros lotus]
MASPSMRSHHSPSIRGRDQNPPPRRAAAASPRLLCYSSVASLLEKPQPSLASLLQSFRLRLHGFPPLSHRRSPPGPLRLLLLHSLATFISARGCWIHSRKRFTDETMSSEFLKKSSKENESDGTSFLNPEETNHAIKSQSHHSKKANVHTVGFLEHLMQAIYQTCAGAVMLTDIVFWCLLVPFLLGDKFQLTLLIGSIHSVNAVFLILDSVLNSQPLTWYGLPYFVIWSVSYVVFQWILHACGFTWWPYPFLELSTPWAPLWYFALALVHLPCYGIYVLLVKAKVWTFSRIFPNAFLRPVNASSRNSMEKKQT